jgi:cellulose biosynthesis protein BcsQ
VRIIVVMNQKGGTGKTTTVVNLGFTLAQSGLRTLLVDLDAQGNLGVSFGIEGERGLYHLLVDGADPHACTVQTASKFCFHQCGVKPTRQGSVTPSM